MTRLVELYLLWSPQGWGVFNSCTCPDPYDFPYYWYRKYEVLVENERAIFERLVAKKDELVKNDVIPSKENYSENFPEISNLVL
jgi:hypothetical protein